MRMSFRKYFTIHTNQMKFIEYSFRAMKSSLSFFYVPYIMVLHFGIIAMLFRIGLFRKVGIFLAKTFTRVIK